MLPYEVGTIIWVMNANVSKVIGNKLAEVTGYRLDGNITVMLYREIETNRESTLPLIFVEPLTKLAGQEAGLIYGKN